MNTSSYRGYLLVVCLLLTGCGPNGPERVPVSGRVTFGGGDWPNPGMIAFNCVKPADGFPSSNGMAQFDRQGNYVLGDQTGKVQGIFPGTYKIRIECWKIPPSMNGPSPQSCLPPEFARGNDERLTVQVPPGAPLIYSFDVPKK
jgi:hypothetical protein